MSSGKSPMLEPWFERLQGSSFTLKISRYGLIFADDHFGIQDNCRFRRIFATFKNCRLSL